MLINSNNFSNNPNINNFCSSVFTLNNPSQKSLLDNSWYFAITPFPKNPYGMTLSNSTFKDSNHENDIDQNRLLDVFYPFNDQKYDKIPVPRFSAHTFILILEISETTNPFISTLFQTLKDYFSQQRPIFFTILIICGNSIKFPYIQKSKKTFSISTWSDFSEFFELQQESLYFNMNENEYIKLFNKYLESIEEIVIEKSIETIDIFDILHSLFPFFKSLRNPIWLICSDLYVHRFSSNEKIEKVSQMFHQSSLNIDFYFIISNPQLNANTNIKNNPSLQLFTTKCNCSVTYFGYSQFEKISIDLLYNISKPRSIFIRLDIFTSDSLEVNKIYGRGCQIESETYKTSTLTVNDTIHVFIKPNTKKLQSDIPKIVFRTRYVEGATNCFMRYIPFDCSNRNTCTEALLTAAAIKIMKEDYDVNDAINELLQLDISFASKNTNFNSLFFRKRYEFAVKSLRLIKNDLWLSNFAIGNCPNNVFEFLSPICCNITRSNLNNSSENLNSNLADSSNNQNISVGEWKIAPEVSFGSALFLIWAYDHQFIFVKSESDYENLSDLEIDQIMNSIDKKGRFEVVDFRNFFENQQLVRIDLLSKNYWSDSSYIK